jgi:hypothetical protein
MNVERGNLMPYNRKSIRGIVILTNGMVLFTLVGGVAFAIPINPEGESIQPVIHADDWGMLPLKMKLTSIQ